MTSRHDTQERYADLLGEQATPTMTRLVAALDEACAPTTPPHASQLDAAMSRMLRARTTTHEHAAPARQRRVLAGMRLRFVSLVTFLLLVASGATAYLRLNAPTPASAQAALIARRAAAAAQLAPNQAAHATYSITVTVPGAENSGTESDGSGALTGTADVWVQADANGNPTTSTQTLSMNKAGMSSRFVQAGQQVYAYNPEMRGDDAIMIDPEGRVHPSWLAPNDVFDGSSATQELSALAQQSPQRVQLLPQQTLDGHVVDVIEVDGWINRPAQRTIFYFDAQSYVLRGFDATGLDPSYPIPSWQARLSSYETVPAANVPPGTFTLNAPASAQVAPPDLGDPATYKTFETAFAGACHTPANVNVKTLVGQGRSFLAACQASNPGITEADLVAALAAPEKETIDAAVAAGQVTSAQEAASLVALQSRLDALVTNTGLGK